MNRQGYGMVAEGRVRHVGEPVAVVAAETPADSAEAVVVDYEPLPAVTDTEAALDPGARPALSRDRVESPQHDGVILEAAPRLVLPTIFPSSFHVEEDGLASYVPLRRSLGTARTTEWSTAGDRVALQEVREVLHGSDSAHASASGLVRQALGHRRGVASAFVLEAVKKVQRLALGAAKKEPRIERRRRDDDRPV